MGPFSEKDVKKKEYEYVELLEYLKLEYPNMINEDIVGLNLVKIDNELFLEHLRELEDPVLETTRLMSDYRRLLFNYKLFFDPSDSLINIAQKIIDLKFHYLKDFTAVGFLKDNNEKVLSLIEQSRKENVTNPENFFRNRVEMYPDFEIKKNEYVSLEVTKLLKDKFGNLILNDVSNIFYLEIHDITLIEVIYESDNTIGLDNSAQWFFCGDYLISDFGSISNKANNLIKMDLFEINYLTKNLLVFEDEAICHINTTEKLFFDPPHANGVIGPMSEEIDKYTSMLPKIIESMVSEPEDNRFDLLPALKIYYGDRLSNDILSIHLERNDKGSIKLVIKDLEEKITEFQDEFVGSYEIENQVIDKEYDEENYDFFDAKISLKDNAIDFLYYEDGYKAMMIHPFFSDNYANELTKNT